MSGLYGNVAGGFGYPKTFVLTNSDGNDIATGVVVGEETVFDATVNDVREGKVFAGDEGVKTGTKVIPAYHTTTGVYYVPANSELKITISDGNKYDYTELQAMVISWNTNYEDSVAVEKVVIDDNVYNVNSTTVVSNVTKDSTNKAISLGIINGVTPVIIRYFSYKGEF